jgi:hypothetical protein
VTALRARSGRSIPLMMRQRRAIILSIGCSSSASTLDCSRRLSCRVQGSLACRSIRGGALAAKLSGVGSLRLAVPIGHLYFCEIFYLGKLSLNDDPHSKPITKANGVVRRQLQAMAADDVRQTWDPLPCRSRNSFFSNWVLRSSLQQCLRWPHMQALYRDSDSFQRFAC